MTKKLKYLIRIVESKVLTLGLLIVGIINLLTNEQLVGLECRLESRLYRVLDELGEKSVSVTFTAKF